MMIMIEFTLRPGVWFPEQCRTQYEGVWRWCVRLVNRENCDGTTDITAVMYEPANDLEAERMSFLPVVEMPLQTWSREAVPLFVEEGASA